MKFNEIILGFLKEECLCNLWLTLGGILLIIEIFGTSGYLFCIGVTSLIIGLLTWVIFIKFELQIIIFSFLSIGLTWLWWHYLNDFSNRCLTKNLILNQRNKQLIGLRIRLSEPIVNGFGRLKIGDSTWKIKSVEDLKAGILVEIYYAECITLHVRPCKI